MKLSQLNPNTTNLENLREDRPAIINMARVIFDKRNYSAIRAFTQFKDNNLLLNLIIARKKGIFNYGDHIIRTGSETWDFPHPIKVNKLFMKELTEKFGQLNEDELIKKLSLQPDETVNIENRFEVKMDSWNTLTDEEKYKKKVELLRDFFEKEGKRALQNKHYEIMSVQSTDRTAWRTKRGEDPNVIIDRLASTDWLPDGVKEVRDKEIQSDWDKLSAQNIDVEDKIKDSTIVETHHNLALENTGDQLVFINKRLDKLMEKVDFIIENLSGSGTMNEQTTEETSDKLTLVGNSVYSESELLEMSKDNLLKVASEVGVKDPEKIMITKFLVKKILKVANL